MVSKGMIRCLVAYGLVWLAGGIMLLFKGVHLVMDPITQPTGKSNPFLFLTDLAGWIGGLQEAALILIVLALIVGHLKARFVFTKTITKLVTRLLAQKPPLTLKKVLPLPYLMIIFLMVGLGALMNVLQVSPDLRGFVDVAIGSALLKGGFYYLRSIGFVRRGEPVRFTREA